MTTYAIGAGIALSVLLAGGAWYAFTLTLADGGRVHLSHVVFAPLAPIILALAGVFSTVAWVLSRLGFGRVLFPVGGWAPTISFNAQTFRCRRVFLLPGDSIFIIGAKREKEQ